MLHQIAFHEASKSLLMRVDDPLSIKEVIPNSKLISHEKYNLAVQHTDAATRVLKNMGLDVPAPISVQYNWPGRYRPFSHQKVMAEFLTLNEKAFNLSEMGVGKSAAALWAADWMMRAGSVTKALIITPLSTLDRVWCKDVYDVLLHRNIIKLHGTREQRLHALSVDVDFYVINHDGVTIKPVADEIAARTDINLIIVDEASMFRNHATQKYKDLRRIIRPDTRLWLLTGTPCPNEPTDAWALARLVNPNRVPQFFGTFKRMTMMEHTRFKWVPRIGAYHTAYEAMQPAVRFKKVDCLDLPPVTTRDWQAPLSAEQKRAFASMRKQMQTEAANGVISAVNAADKVNKLRQILCGAVKHPDAGDYSVLDHTPRLEVLKQAIDSANAKVLVIVPFKGIIRSLEIELSKNYSVNVLNGDVPPRQRDKIIRRFKEEAEPNVLLCHPKVMAHGLNLTEADTLVFYAPIYSNDEYRQVIERFNRAGQTRKMTVIRMAAHSLEWAIYKMVDTRGVTQDNILKLYKTVTA